MANFLDTAGLTYLWGKIKTALSGKVDKVSGKGLSTNDYTTAEKNKLAGIETGANKYVHPSYTAKTNGLYKVTVDAAGHVSSTTPVTKTDITGLGIPASNTTYSDFKGATANAAGTHGLVPAPAKGDTGKLLSGKGTWEAMTMAYTEEDYTQASVGLTFAGSTCTSTRVPWQMQQNCRLQGRLPVMCTTWKPHLITDRQAPTWHGTAKHGMHWAVCS